LTILVSLTKGTKANWAKVYAAGMTAGQLYGAEFAKYPERDVRKAQAEAAKAARVNVVGIPSWMTLG
jgi:hypothetical protein